MPRWLIAVVLTAFLAGAAWFGADLVTTPSDPPPASKASSPAVTLTASSAPSEIAAAEQQLVSSGRITFIREDQWDPGTIKKCHPEQDFPSGSGPKYAAPQLYYKVVAFLQIATTAGFQIRLNCIVTGHPNNGLLHPQWRAVDIGAINGEKVTVKSAQSQAFAAWLFARPNDQLPFEVGGPEVDEKRLKETGSKRRGPFFTNSDHKDHWHLGFKPADDTSSYHAAPWW